jgi:hypothetical protein
MKNIYFANKEAKECVKVLMSKIENWEKELLTSGLANKIKRSWSFYHGSFGDDLYNWDDHRISSTGEQGELLKFPVNHFRNIGSYMLNMTASNRPAMQAKSVNTDYKSQTQTILANGLLDYYMREKSLEDVIKRVTEYAIVLGEGWVKMEWDSTAGEQYGYNEETKTPVYEGDINYLALTPFDVIRDVNKNDSEIHNWYIVKSYKNKYDLMAKYQDLSDKIEKVETRDVENLFKLSSNTDKSDEVAIYEFYHRKTDAVPDGRYIMFINDEIIPVDAPLPYRDIPLYTINPSKMIGTTFGYTIMFDLLPIQEAINMLYSVILTNQNAFGVQNIMIPKGSDINLQQLAGGLNIIEYNPGMEGPRPLNLTSTPAEVFNMLNKLENTMETISGINSVVRGNPESNLRSGNALALVQAQALIFASNLQQSYVRLVESLGTATIRILQDYAEAPRVAAIVGKANRTYLKEFTGKDVSSINRVVVEISNPLSKTTAGRAQMATELIQYGIVDNVEQYFNVLNTGNLDTMTQSQQHELTLIQSENEKLMEGEQVTALAIDSHLMHIKEHKSVLYDPDLRKDPILVQATLDHIQEHINMLREVDPGLLQSLGEQPLPPTMPQGGMPPPGEDAPVPKGEGPTPEQPIPTGLEAAEEQILPNMPGLPPNVSDPNMPTTPEEAMARFTG